MDTYADDLATLVKALDLHAAIHVGHSTGGGEVARYIGHHGASRVAKAVLLGAVPPLMLKTEQNPGGLPIEVFDGIRKATFDDRSQFFKDLTVPFYGYNREGTKIFEGVRSSFWLQGMTGRHQAALHFARHVGGDGSLRKGAAMVAPGFVGHQRPSPGASTLRR